MLRLNNMIENSGNITTTPTVQYMKLELLINKYTNDNTTHDANQTLIKISKFITTLNKF